MGEQNEQVNQETPLFKSRVFEIVERQQRGRSGKLLQRHIVKHPGAVGIVPVLPDGRVALIRQYRISVNQMIYEIPAGTREQGEEPIVTARRELIEETGYRCENLKPLTSIFTSPGILQEELFLFLATELTAGENALEDGELIELEPKTWSEIDEMIDSGAIQDSKTLVGLLLAERALNIHSSSQA